MDFAHFSQNLLKSVLENKFIWKKLFYVTPFCYFYFFCSNVKADFAYIPLKTWLQYLNPQPLGWKSSPLTTRPQLLDLFERTQRYLKRKRKTKMFCRKTINLKSTSTANNIKCNLLIINLKFIRFFLILIQKILSLD